MEEKIYQLNIEDISKNPYQPRRNFDSDKLNELSHSIEVNGVLQPIIVRKSNLFGYELLAGERRLRASKLANLDKIPAIIRSYSDNDMMVLSILENLQRDDMSPLDEAESIKKIIEKSSMTHDEVAKHLGKSRSYISNLLRILKLPQEILLLLEEKKISLAHARTLLAEENKEKQVFLAHKTIQEKLNVRQLEDLIYQKDSNKKISNKKSIYIVEKEKELTKCLGISNKISYNEKLQKGKLELYFESLEKLEELLNKLTKNSQ
ncbi:ParB/RepB/Spo0J family partition protein [Lactococcus formosensis]|jgi:ParB family chromosome partitioning protein|uniref:ParB/RepB/Spo0J family partition protein n=1 Tax=Lactococcus formosensis TaxID=1281486 RepID=A0A9X4SG90_9LACT|nr:ParB/RepB/Spo0J family partition protein [Lactococcus formosensis]NHI67104.1 ParB/RepB/Spo0J family partition protein [Lactococcus garvieae]MCH1722521.1 ParB/RepB/Spo0J family partition protein [Lactococcus formosensis]MDG6113278.1 ParB/RepB/Spo0J family partition protein [Lactococcus formosensis]MDG6114713.1 ParB/RepB/Spo0J family partition protein [Lactococcus formosensis]MDG6118859.1 ParB/RepB/Spo0J family partition protein [Lactococcus formosensis]